MPDRPRVPRKPTEPELPWPAGMDEVRLDPAVRREVRSLTAENAATVERHLVAAGMLLDEDPSAAYEHAKRAKARAARLGAVREALGITAYHAADYGVALAELRAARRITGAPDHLPLIADCERALGRPERALAVADDPDARRLEQAAKAELAIVLSGARRDLGQADAAIAVLERHGVSGDAMDDWTPRLWYAYADALLAAGRTGEAREWFTAVASVDDDDTTDAEERLAALPPSN